MLNNTPFCSHPCTTIHPQKALLCLTGFPPVRAFTTVLVGQTNVKEYIYRYYRRGKKKTIKTHLSTILPPVKNVDWPSNNSTRHVLVVPKLPGLRLNHFGFNSLVQGFVLDSRSLLTGSTWLG